MRTIVTAGLLVLSTAGWGLCGDGEVVCQASTAAPPITAEARAAAPLSADGAALHAEIQRLARTVELARRGLGRAIEEGTPTGPDLADDGAGWLRLLDHLEYEAERLGGSDGPYLSAKAAVVRRLAQDIVRHAGDVTGAPQPGAGPPSAPSPSRRTAVAAQTASNDACADALPIGFETVTGETTTATNDGRDYCGNSAASPDVWFRFTAVESGWVTAATIGSDFDTVLGVRSACPSDPDSTRIACNDDMFGLQSGVSFEAVAGKSYLIRVSGAANATGSFVLTVGRGGRVVGTVTDATTGLPIEGAPIDAVTAGGWESATGVTGADGRYEIIAPDLSPLTVSATGTDGYLNERFDDIQCTAPPTYSCPQDAAVVLDVSTPDAVVTADFALEPAAGMAGDAVDGETGEPITSELSVWVFDADWNLVRQPPRQSGPDWSIEELPPGEFLAAMTASGYDYELFDDVRCVGGVCDPSAGTPIVLRPGEVTGGVSFSPAPLGRIRGTLTDAATGGPAQASVKVLDTEGNEAASCWSSSTDGGYLCGGLLPGRYRVRFGGTWYSDVLYPDIPCEEGCSLADGGVVEITEPEPEASGIDATIRPLGTITGTVVDESTGAPLPGISVAACRTSSWSSCRTALTNPNGRYAIRDLSDHVYTLAVEDGVEYVPEVYDNVICHGQCDLGVGTTVSIADGEPVSGIDFALAMGSSITGHARDARTGDPLQEEVLRLWPSAGGVVTTSSDADGAFRFQGLAAGRYYVSADSSPTHLGALYDGLQCPESCNGRLGTPVDIAEGAPTTVAGIDLGLTQKGAISGRVTAADTGALVPAMVRVWNELGVEVASTWSSTDAYTVNGLTGGSYYVTATPTNVYLSGLYDGVPCTVAPPAGCPVTGGTPVHVALGHTTPGIDVTVARGATVEGTITDRLTGEPLAGDVEVWRNGLRYRSTWSPDGPYSISGLPPGSAFVVLRPTTTHLGQVYDGIDCSNCSGAGQGTPVELTPGSVVPGIDFAAARKGSLRGSVVSAASGATLPGITVRLRNVNGSLMDSEVTSDSGEFLFTGVTPGSYLLETSSPDYLDELYPDIPCGGACPLAKGELITVESGTETRHIEFTLQRLGAIEGRVTDAITGEPVPNVWVSAYELDGSEAGRANTDANGRYRVARLEGGAYYAGIPAFGSSSGLVPQFYAGYTCQEGNVVACLPGATPVPVELDGVTDGIDLAVKHRGTISGVVTANRDGSPVTTCTLRLYDIATGASRGSRTCGGVSGDYTFGSLPWGSYALYISSSALVPELYDDVSCPGGLGQGCLLDAALPVTVSANAPARTGVDLGVDFLGVLRGETRDADTGEPVATTVHLYDAGGTLVGARSGASSYRFAGLAPGIYHVAASAPGYVAEMFDGVACDGATLDTCDLGLATPVTAAVNDEVVADIGLDRPTGQATFPLSATVTASQTGAPIAAATVSILDGQSSLRGSCSTGSDGSCTTNLPAGTYYARTAASGYERQLYDGIACPGTCDVTKGTPIDLGEAGASVQVALQREGPAVEGRVTISGGAPVPFVVIDAWNAQDDSWESSTMTDLGGYYHLALPPGVHHLGTDNGQGLIDEVYDDVACPDGPAYEGLCDPALGASVSVTEKVTPGVDFVLSTPPATIFSDGFEGGGWQAWSAVVGR